MLPKIPPPPSPARLSSMTHPLKVALASEWTNTPPPMLLGSRAVLPAITQFAKVAVAAPPAGEMI